MIKLYRSITVIFLFVLFGFGALYIRYLILPFKKNQIEKYETLQKSWQFFIWLMEKLTIIDVKVDDTEKLKSIKNSIIVSTHPSFIDIVILMSIVPHSTCFVANKLTKNPFFKGMVDLLFILETDSIDEWLNKCDKKIQEGLNIIIFPMGTRHKKDEHLKIRRGTALIAQRTGRNIAALHMETSFDFLQVHQPIYEAGDRPVEFSINYIKEINTQELLNKYPDEVEFKSELTKIIKDTLYLYKK